MKSAPETRWEPPFPLHETKVTIRTLSLSLLAIAAVAASLTLVRHREQRLPEARDLPPDPHTTYDAELLAIRSAGL